MVMKVSGQVTPTAIDSLDGVTLKQAFGGSLAPDFIQATLSTSFSSGLTEGTVIPFDTELVPARGLTVNGSGRFSGFKAGKTYFCMASLQITSSNRFPMHFWDVTNSVALGHVGTFVGANFNSSAAYSPVPMALFTPSEDIEVEFRCAADPTSASTYTVEPTNAWGTVTSIVFMELSSTPVLGGALEFMDEIDVDSAVASITFGEGGDGKFDRALDGDVDSIYELHYLYFKDGSSLETLEVFPNGADPGSNATFDRMISNASNVSGDSGSGWAIIHGATVDGQTDPVFDGVSVIRAKTGQKRTMRSTGSAYNPAGTNSLLSDCSATWHDDSTNITSLQIINPAGNIQPGSRFRLYRRKSTPGANAVLMEILDEGTTLTNTVSGIDFVGAGVNATASGTLIRVEVNPWDSMSHLQAHVSTDTAINQDNPIVWNVEDENHGSNISLNTSTGAFTLAGQHTYLVTCNIYAYRSGAGMRREFQVYNEDTASLVPGTITSAFNATALDSAAGAGTITWRAAPASDTDYSIHMITGGAGTTTMGGPATHLSIIQLT